jgi:fumarylacetoacetate (FAA) hydrolase
MKLATLKSSSPDGQLAVVSRDLRFAKAVPDIASTLQQALDRWEEVSEALRRVYDDINESSDLLPKGGVAFNPNGACSPLPRAYQWCDGSTYIAHTERMARWRQMEIPKVLFEEPLVYQGGSDIFLGPCDPIELTSEEWGLDFEAEIAVITGAVRMGTPASRAGTHIKLLMLCNDVSLRNLIPRELGKGFGFYQSKPSSAFSPVAVTPDELGPDWDGSRLHATVISNLNGVEFGRPNSGVEMQFGFADIIAHAAKTRDLGPGSIFGSGTVANRDLSVGSSCITERRMIETVENGKAKTDYLAFGDRVRIEAFGSDGASLFGAINQVVEPFRG